MRCATAPNSAFGHNRCRRSLVNGGFTYWMFFKLKFDDGLHCQKNVVIYAGRQGTYPEGCRSPLGLLAAPYNRKLKRFDKTAHKHRYKRGWGEAPSRAKGRRAPLFSPFPKGEGGLGVGGYNNPSGTSNPDLHPLKIFLYILLKKHIKKCVSMLYIFINNHFFSETIHNLVCF